jgi:hypothetical protein
MHKLSLGPVIVNCILKSIFKALAQSSLPQRQSGLNRWTQTPFLAFPAQRPLPHVWFQPFSCDSCEFLFLLTTTCSCKIG